MYRNSMKLCCHGSLGNRDVGLLKSLLVPIIRNMGWLRNVFPTTFVRLSSKSKKIIFDLSELYVFLLMLGFGKEDSGY